MRPKFRHYNIRFEQSQWDSIADLAAQRGVPPAQIIRAAIERHLATETLLDVSSQRIARVNEFQQLALDVIMREQFPEYRDRIKSEIDKLMATYHA